MTDDAGLEPGTAEAVVERVYWRNDKCVMALKVLRQRNRGLNPGDTLLLAQGPACDYKVGQCVTMEFHPWDALRRNEGFVTVQHERVEDDYTGPFLKSEWFVARVSLKRTIRVEDSPEE